MRALVDKLHSVADLFEMIAVHYIIATTVEQHSDVTRDKRIVLYKPSRHCVVEIK